MNSQVDSASSCTHNISYNDDDQYDQHNQPRRSTRQNFTYQSFQEESKCIICAAVKKDAHGKVVPVQTMTFRETDDSLHLAEKQLKEFAQIHVENCTKFQDAGQRVLLNSSTTTTLFAANLGYHKSCYQAFRAPSWKKTQSQEIYCSERNYIDEMVDVIEYLVALKRELYTLRQVRELYANIEGVGVDSIRSIDIKNVIEKRLEAKVRCCIPRSAKKHPVRMCVICRCQYFA